MIDPHNDWLPWLCTVLILGAFTAYTLAIAGVDFPLIP